MEELNKLSYAVRGAAFKVHTALGPGLLESTYEKCMAIELRRMSLSVKQQPMLPIDYEGTIIENAYRIDLLVEEKLIVELKSVQQLTPIDTSQLLTYLKLAKLRLGLLMNFNVNHMRDGIKRLIR
ncbi:GxxExxY protein [Neolewinella sp.]|uniref:GxxExxY protein n=1 Tax=Neolewinella sp. TaxID=2993543 RepID=UPI003B5155BB